MRLGAVCCLGLLVALGCSGDDHAGRGAAGGVSLGGSDGGRRFTCIDEDGDGFGSNCASGPDCDDDDPSITDECVRCDRDPTGCACEPGTPSVSCIPRDMRVTMNGVTGTLKCSEGARYCREGAWSGCEFLAQYTTFVPD
jgi:hypothetical protein